jgi:hypothetical protein
MPGVLGVIAAAIGWNIYALRHNHDLTCWWIRKHPKTFFAFCAWFGIHLWRGRISN